MVAMEDHPHNPDIHNHQVQRSMFRRFRDGTRDPNRATFVTLLALITESVACTVDAMVPSRCWPRLRSPSSERLMHRAIVRLVFAEVFLCHTGLRHSMICSGKAPRLRLWWSRNCAEFNGWTSANPRASRGVPQTMCCGNFVAVRARFPTIANFPLGFLQSALILDSRTLGKEHLHAALRCLHRKACCVCAVS